MTPDRQGITIALSDSFLRALQRLPSAVKAKTMDAIDRFHSSPDAVGRNLEPIAHDFMSMRVDLAYRAILCRLDQGRSYLLVWVDHHDEAYQWAERRRVLQADDVIQIVRTEETTEETGGRRQQPDGIFARYKARHLMRLGVPAEMIDYVQSIQNAQELADAAIELHPRVYEALTYLAEGFSIGEVTELMEETASLDVAETNGSSLRSAANRQNMIVINNALDLQAVQDAFEQPLDRWRLFLHASQRRLVEANFTGPAKVTGGAGTGKTVVAIHRAKHLVENLFNHPDMRILLTTFTVNLAEDLQCQLAQICNPAMLARIDVINIDKLIVLLMKQYFPAYRVVYGEEVEAIWQQTMQRNQHVGSLKPSFFIEEWNKVVVPQKIGALGHYLQADRSGRGVRLSRPEKKEVWSVIACYRDIMLDSHAVDAMMAASLLAEKLSCEQGQHHYIAIIVDEAQDFNEVSLSLLRSLCGPEHPNDLFLVGDAHQRIYQRQIRLSACGINVQSRSYKLHINYRTTEQIRLWASALFAGQSVDDLDLDEDDGRGYLSLLSGPEPEMQVFPDMDSEIDHIAQIVSQLAPDADERKNVCLTLRTTQLLNQYRYALEEKGFRLYEIKTNNADQQTIPGLRIATMHRVKGLDFDHMIAGAVNDAILPLKAALDNAGDPIARKEAEAAERALLYVAATRAKKTLHVFSHGKPSELLLLRE